MFIGIIFYHPMLHMGTPSCYTVHYFSDYLLDTMNITIKATHIELADGMHDYITEKFQSIERFFPTSDADAIAADIEVGRPSQHHQKGDVYRCEINLRIGGHHLRAVEEGESLQEVVDLVRDEIERQARKIKGKRQAQFLKGARELARRLREFRSGRRP